MKTKNYISPEHVDNLIKHSQFHRFKGTTLTVCCITLVNGHTVLGESAYVDPENFDADIGQRLAFDKARDKIFALEGYLLAEALHQHKRQTNSERSTDVKRAFIKLSEQGRKMEWPESISNKETPLRADFGIESTEEAEQDECCHRDCGQCTKDDELDFPALNIEVHIIEEDEQDKQDNIVVDISEHEREVIEKLMSTGGTVMRHQFGKDYRVVELVKEGAICQPQGE